MEIGTNNKDSLGVYTLVTPLATCRVGTLAWWGEPPFDKQMRLEVTNLQRGLSTATVCATSSVLLAWMSNVGQGSREAGVAASIDNQKGMNDSL